MKNSNKILLVAIMALIIATVIYNLSLKAEYLAGFYKNPYHYAKSLNIKNFNAIHNKAGNIFDVIVKKCKSSTEIQLFLKIARKDRKKGHLWILFY